MRVLKSGLTAAVLLAAGLSGAKAIEGTWLRGDGNARVRIAPCGDKVCATNLWIGDTSSGEEVGDRLVMTLAPEGEGKFGGTAFDPKRGRTYTIVITTSGDRLSTRGCILGRVLCREVTWTAAR
ncbi:DUF2147 domain-containing protein [Phreatobacter cathodiphilus]|uniref:DUF2147 domain-containing protein n=1 Tax=Phreatobacter cathodiphilus TaxID=1868589 RepID=A0A2S0N6S2_9HYPH|nr:DUF2147 domain-containing protein [Phreatobacter cathodiphilus]AVO43864.1 DUF2147 domain-containing protein [Phreatobacter cathodiphilus]